MKLPEKICLFSAIPGQEISKTVLIRTIYDMKQIFIYPRIYFVAQIVDHAKKQPQQNKTPNQNQDKV